jgi:hypothetical protein
MGQQIQFEMFNPFRRPEWRFERVLQMTSRMPSPGRCSPRDDEYVKIFRTFYLRYLSYDEEGRKNLAYENPGLFWAFQIYDGRQVHSRKSTTVEARILAGATDDEIADELHTIPGVVKWYEAMFFNVRDRLQSSDWIVDHVLMPSYEASMTAGEDDTAEAENPPPQQHFERTPLSEPFYDATLKMFGYFGGPVVLDYVLACGFRRGAVAQGLDDLSGWFDNHTFTRLRHRSGMASQSFEVNKYNVMELFQTHLRIVEIEKSGDAAESQQSAIFSNIASMLKNMPWGIGREGKKLVAGTPVEQYDESAAELRDTELMELSSGRKPRTIEGIELLKLPPPSRQSNGQEDHKHADTQQGR